MRAPPQERARASLAERLVAFCYRPDEDVSRLALPPAGTGTLLPEPAAEALREYLSFQLAETTYAVPLGTVLEILRARLLVEIPRAKAPLLGVLDLRGTVTPVYDLALGLGLRTQLRKVAGPPEECEVVPREARILVARTQAGPAGMWVDSVRDVVRLAPASIATVSGEGAVVGRALAAQQPLVLLELERVL
ncbi:MAG: chemotaxis protein CheW [Myxococcaceae bacterium]